VPKVSRFALLHGGNPAAARAIFKDAEGTAKALAVHFELIDVTAPNPDIEGAFQTIVKDRIGALITEAAPPINFNRKKILELLERNRLPAMHSEDLWANDGGLMSYGANRVEPFRRAAAYVDKILKGTKPAD